MKNPGIYILTNCANNKKYVGKDRNLPNRIKLHFNGSGGARLLKNAIQKYEQENFNIELIPYPGISHESLYAVEQWKIAQLNSKSPNGYNLTDGGAGTIGHRHTAESRNRMSQAQKSNGRIYKKGWKHTKESCRKMRENSGARKPDARRKMSEAAKGKQKSDEHKSNIKRNNARAFLGKKHTAETRRKMRETKSRNSRNKNQLYLFDL